MRNGLKASEEIAIPVDTGYFSLHGLTQQLATLRKLAERDGATPTVRVLTNQYDVRTKLAREILAELTKQFEGVLYDTIINFNTKLKEGASFGQPITEFAPNSMGARDFQKLARELIAGEPSRTATADLMQHVEKLAADADRLLATTATLVENRPGATPLPRVEELPPPARKARAIVSVAFPGADFDYVSEAARNARMKISHFIRAAALEKADAVTPRFYFPETPKDAAAYTNSPGSATVLSVQEDVAVSAKQ